MIELSKYDKMWIKMCKMHYKDKYPLTGVWAKNLIPLFQEIYGWDPNTDYQGYLNVIFEKLLDLHLRIVADHSGCNRQLKEIFNAAFHKSFARGDELPEERAISALCGLIQCNPVIDNIYGIEAERYSLEITEKEPEIKSWD